MRELDADVSTKIAWSATGAAAALVRKAARSNIISNSSKNGSAVDRGDLRDAVIVKRMPKNETPYTAEHIVTVRGRGKKSKKTGKVSASAPHGHFVEFGTVNMPPEPYLRPAIEENADKAVAVMKDKIAARIAKVKKK